VIAEIDNVIYPHTTCSRLFGSRHRTI